MGLGAHELPVFLVVVQGRADGHVGEDLTDVGATADELGQAWVHAQLEVVVVAWLDVLVETECAHGPEQVVAVDGFPLFLLAFITGFGGNKRDKLAHALLDGVLRVFRNLRAGRHDPLHDAGNVCHGEKSVLFARLAMLSLFPVVRHGNRDKEVPLGVLRRGGIRFAVFRLQVPGELLFEALSGE